MPINRTSVPWIYADTLLVKSWTWKTTHFDAKILSGGNGDGYSWKVTDKTGASPKTLNSGEELDFVAAEAQILELVGKAYPRSLGYHAYAGDLATTFVLQNGKKINLGSFSGSNVIVEVYNKNNPQTPYIVSGIFTLKNYKAIVKTDTNNIAISPEQIMNIRKEYNSDEALIVKSVNETALSRVINEEWRPGCTGQPGFRSGTLIHKAGDESCPFHD